MNILNPKTRLSSARRRARRCAGVLAGVLVVGLLLLRWHTDRPSREPTAVSADSPGCEHSQGSVTRTGAASDRRHTSPAASGTRAAAAHQASPARAAPDTSTPAPPVLGTTAPGVSTATVIASSTTHTRLAFTLGDYTLGQRQFIDRMVTVVDLPQARQLKVRDHPALPCWRTNVIVPTDAELTLRIVDAEYEEFACAPPMPSTGFVGRSDPPSPAPRFGSAYTGTTPFPETSAVLTRSYMLRQIRGVGVVFFPFQYLPERRALRVYGRIEVDVVSVPGTVRAAPPDLAQLRSREFAAAVRTSFVNAPDVFTASRAVSVTAEPDPATAPRAGPLLTDGPETLLVVAPGPLRASLAPFVAWKRQRGLDVTVAEYPTDTGSGDAALAAYIKDRYEQDGIVYVILVGDSTDIPTTAYPSDTLYTRVSGDDDYHDLFISRISASTTAQVENQIAKILTYERAPTVVPDAGWYSRAVMVGSAEGQTSEFGLDKEVLAQERLQLLAYGYTAIDEIYDPRASKSAVVAAWNEGRGLIYYLGHGSVTSWNTTGLAVTDIMALGNGAALPFVLNGNCRNGNFTYATDCMAEAMMKAGTDTTPAGAVGTVASTTNMDWDPPIVMVQAFTEYITGAAPVQAGGMTFADAPLSSLGGFAFFSIQRAMEYCYNTPGAGDTAASKIMSQTHLFGDCTLGLRTRTPALLTVDHATQLVPGIPFQVRVATAGRVPLAEATVCLYRDADVQIVGWTDADGLANLDLGPLTGAPVNLTVYHRNAIPYQIELPVADGALVITSPASLPPAFVEEAYSFTPAAIGGEPPYAWEAGAGCPDWLVMDGATGILTGTPTESALSTFTIQVQDGDVPPSTYTQTVTLQTGVPVRFSTDGLEPGIVGEAYSVRLACAGTFVPFVFAMTAGEVPPGLTLSASGSLRGIPTQAGDYTFTLTATDQADRTAARTFTLIIAAAPDITITTADVLPAAERAQAYTHILTATGGSGTGLTWSVTAGTLPPGLTLAAAGTLAGIPTLEGEYVFTVRVQDDMAPPNLDERQLTLEVESDVYFTTTILPGATAGQAYAAAVPVGGSHLPFTFSEPAQTGYEQGTQPTTFSSSGQNRNWYGDEIEWSLDFGFAFPFYGETYTGCWVGDNGYLRFGGTAPDPMWEATTANFTNQVMIAPLWTDLEILAQHAGTGIFVESQTDRVTVRWCGRDWHFPDDELNFSVTLHADGRIAFRYGAISTSNRVVVGICAGNATDQELLYSHPWYDWNWDDPDYIQGWDGHNDIVFLVPKNLPDWLILGADGTLAGTPLDSGTYTFTVEVQDAAGNAATSDVSVTVCDYPPADADNDGDIDNTEILAFAELWRAGLVPEAEFAAAVEIWRSGGPRTRTEPAAPEPIANVVAPGPVYAVLVDVGDRAEIDALTRAGFDVAGVRNATVRLYVSEAELAALRTMGYAPEIVACQEPGSARPGTTDSRAPGGYHTYTDLVGFLEGVAAQHPQRCRLSSIGRSVQGRDLWVLKITDNPDVEEDEPEVKIVSTIHGDEPLGTELTVLLIEHLLNSYGMPGGDGPRVTALVDTTEIWIMPCMNPDGLEADSRYNANRKDLNRSFPDGVEKSLPTVFEAPPDTAGLEPEVAAVMTWSAQQSFVLSAGLHTGSLLVCYPYGNNPQAVSVDTPTPDDLLFEYLARQYTSHNTAMWTSPTFPNGITNAAAWYVVTGEMPDWNYRVLGTLETTAELAFNDPDAGLIADYWEDNRESLLAYLESVHMGIRGRVTDAVSGAPIWAQVTIHDNGHPMFTDPDVGDYHRPLLSGTYDLTVTAPGYAAATMHGIAVATDAPTRCDVTLTPLTPHSVTRAFPEPRYQPGSTASVALAVDISETERPVAFIVTETLPEDCQYLDDSTTDRYRNLLGNPRVTDRVCSWLFWGSQVKDYALTYQIAIPADRRGILAFTGQMEIFSTTLATKGQTSWQSISGNERVLYLNEGWNLFSVPLILDDPRPAAIFSALNRPVVLRWNGQAYEEASALSSKEGYWIYCSKPCAVVLSGQPETETRRVFSPGWNLFGPLGDRPLLDAPEFSGGAWYWHGRHALASQLQEGLGYWIFATHKCTVDLAW